MTEWTAHQQAQRDYSYAEFAHAKRFVFDRWCELSIERHKALPADLSGSCKYGSLFMNQVFGGTIQGHYEHQYNIIGGRIVDLSHDAMDVGKMQNPYRHEPDFFVIPQKKISLSQCLPRVKRWVIQFLDEV